ncbi:MAG: radical SAM protein [Clostridia bacterium]|nr:radical SAM protein [Clostridia bacterium]
MAKNAILPIFIPHLGCPNDCVFCDQRSISGAIAAPTPEDLRNAIEDGLARLSPTVQPELAFYGGSFTAIDPALQEAYLAVAEPFLREGRLSSIRISTRPDAISPEILARLIRYGVKTVELGAQSMDDRVLAACRRGHTAEDTRRAARALRDAGLSLVLQMMVGLPEDSAEGAVATAHALAELLPDAVRIYPTVVIEKTALAALWQQGRYAALTPDDAAEICARLIAVFSVRNIPILRIGLNESVGLAERVVAGAYHPALGELCYARAYLHRMRAMLRTLPAVSAVTVRVAPSRASVAAGHRRENLEALLREFPHLRTIRIQADLAEPDGLEIFSMDAPK